MFPAAAGSGMPGCRGCSSRSPWMKPMRGAWSSWSSSDTAAAGMVQSMVQSPQISSISMGFPQKSSISRWDSSIDGISPNKNHPFLDGILSRKIIYFWDFPEQKASSYWGSPGWSCNDWGIQLMLYRQITVYPFMVFFLHTWDIYLRLFHECGIQRWLVFLREIPSIFMDDDWG